MTNTFLGKESHVIGFCTIHLCRAQRLRYALDIIVRKRVVIACYLSYVHAALDTIFV